MDDLVGFVEAEFQSQLLIRITRLRQDIESLNEELRQMKSSVEAAGRLCHALKMMSEGES